jgi:hypothetical protein
MNREQFYKTRREYRIYSNRMWALHEKKCITLQKLRKKLKKFHKDNFNINFYKLEKVEFYYEIVPRFKNRDFQYIYASTKMGLQISNTTKQGN